MNNQDNLQQQDVQTVLSIAIQHAHSGNREKARRMLLEIVEHNPSHEEVWLWLAGLADDLEDAQVYLETVLALNPTHAQAQKGLALVKRRQAQEEKTPKQKPQAKRAPHPASPATAPCPSCGQPKAGDVAICPSCGYIEGKPAVEEVSELQPIPAAAQPAGPPLEVNDEITPSFMLSIEPGRGHRRVPGTNGLRKRGELHHPGRRHRAADQRAGQDGRASTRRCSRRWRRASCPPPKKWPGW